MFDYTRSIALNIAIKKLKLVSNEASELISTVSVKKYAIYVNDLTKIWPSPIIL